VAVDHILLVIAITEGIGFIGVMLRFSYKAGKVIQMIENHERRIVTLESDRKEVRE
jgi:ribosomal protein L3